MNVKIKFASIVFKITVYLVNTQDEKDYFLLILSPNIAKKMTLPF